MKKQLLIGAFGLIQGFSLVWAVPQINAPDPIYSLFDDESDRMVIQPMALELNPVSLGIDKQMERNLESLLNPQVLGETLSLLLHQQTIQDLSLSLTESPASFSTLWQRAQAFQTAGLVPVAHEQFSYLLQKDPQNKQALLAQENLVSVELNQSIKKSQAAYKEGDLDAALQYIQRALILSPKNTQALALKKQWLQEQELKKQMESRVNKIMQKGIGLYQSGQWDAALASFVSVLNLDPTNKQARAYIEKIEPQIPQEQR